MNRLELIEHCLTFPFSYEDYPFDRIIGPAAWTVMRHSSNEKGFAFIFERDGKLSVNLKTDPHESALLRRLYGGISPAYHMNKEHWNTVVVDTVPNELLFKLIHHSYNLIKPKPKPKRSDNKNGNSG